MTGAPVTDCPVHGAARQATFVCRHVAESLLHRRRVGFFWAGDQPENPRPDAWCGECERRVLAANLDVAAEAAVFRGNVEVLCGECYDEARALNLG